MDDKVYTPVVIPDAPFPTQPQQPQASTSPSAGGVYTHQQISDTPMPTKIIAHEVMNNALNTKTRKILAEFNFTKFGAIQIGDFEEGQHGDVRISPDGITARNVNGETTFAIDGDTGDAVFKGEIQAADFVVIDNKGLISLNSFLSDIAIKTNYQLITGDNVWTNITDLSFILNLERDSHVIIFGAISFIMVPADGSASPLFRLSYNNLFFPVIDGWNAGWNNNIFTFTHLLILPAGQNVITIQGATSTPDANLFLPVSSDGYAPSSLGYLILGR